MAPRSSNTGRVHGARSGIDSGGALMRISGEVRNLEFERCGCRPAGEDRVAMMTDSLGDTNVHIISRVEGSGTERRRRDHLRSSEFEVRTGFLADDILGRARRGMHGEGLVFRHLCLAHFLDAECLTDVRTQTQGSAV